MTEARVPQPNPAGRNIDGNSQEVGRVGYIRRWNRIHYDNQSPERSPTPLVQDAPRSHTQEGEGVKKRVIWTTRTVASPKATSERTKEEEHEEEEGEKPVRTGDEMVWAAIAAEEECKGDTMNLGHREIVGDTHSESEPGIFG